MAISIADFHLLETEPGSNVSDPVSNVSDMTKTKTNRRHLNPKVFGESAELILRAFSDCERTVLPSGMHQLETTMTAEESIPVVRAFMRAEAKLLKEDADSYDPDDDEARTQAQRGFDAAFLVVTEASKALNRSRR